jgi:hypothetical protein
VLRAAHCTVQLRRVLLARPKLRCHQNVLLSAWRQLLPRDGW